MLVRAFFGTLWDRRDSRYMLLVLLQYIVLDSPELDAKQALYTFFYVLLRSFFRSPHTEHTLLVPVHRIVLGSLFSRAISIVCKFVCDRPQRHIYFQAFRSRCIGLVEWQGRLPGIFFLSNPNWCTYRRIPIVLYTKI